MANKSIYVTKRGLKKLEEELEYLSTIKRQEVAQRLHEAIQGGELIENAEYEAAKNEQAFVEGRIIELKYLISQARIISASRKKDAVTIGNTVIVREGNNKEEERYKIVGVTEASPKDGLISNESPLGKALLGHKVGDKVEVSAPSGLLHFHIVKIK